MQLSLQHDELIIHRAYIIDLLVEDQVIVEIKCVSKIAPIHIAQVRTYLKLTGLHVGLIINFNVTRLVDGLKRVVNEYVDETPDCPPATEETRRSDFEQPANRFTKQDS